jgi:hypothetical protein
VEEVEDLKLQQVQESEREHRTWCQAPPGWKSAGQEEEFESCAMCAEIADEYGEPWRCQGVPVEERREEGAYPGPKGRKVAG